MNESHITLTKYEQKLCKLEFLLKLHKLLYLIEDILNLFFKQTYIRYLHKYFVSLLVLVKLCIVPGWTLCKILLKAREAATSLAKRNVISWRHKDL